MQMKRDEFRQMVWPHEGSIDQRLAILFHHLSMLVKLEDDQRLGFSPGGIKLFASSLFPAAVPLAFLGFA